MSNQLFRGIRVSKPPWTVAAFSNIVSFLKFMPCCNWLVNKRSWWCCVFSAILPMTSFFSIWSESMTSIINWMRDAILAFKFCEQANSFSEEKASPGELSKQTLSRGWVSCSKLSILNSKIWSKTGTRDCSTTLVCFLSTRWPR